MSSQWCSSVTSHLLKTFNSIISFAQFPKLFLSEHCFKHNLRYFISSFFCCPVQSGRVSLFPKTPEKPLGEKGDMSTAEDFTLEKFVTLHDQYWFGISKLSIVWVVYRVTLTVSSIRSIWLHTGEDVFSLQNEMSKENLLVFDFTWLYEEKCMKLYLNDLENKNNPFWATSKIGLVLGEMGNPHYLST